MFGWLNQMNPNQDISSYYELHQLNQIIFYDHLVIILQVPMVNKSLIMNVY